MRRQKSEFVGKGMNDYVEVEGVTIGQDSASGAAVDVYFPELAGEGDRDGRFWIPYSQVDKLTRSPTKGGDKIRMSRWIARKIGLEV